MNLEVFTKKGELRKNSPKRYSCTHCGDKQSSNQAGKLKLPGVTFLNCRKCRGKLVENPSYWEWMIERDNQIEEMKRKSRTSQETVKGWFR